MVGLHVGEEADVDLAERLVVGLVDPPPDHAGEEAQRDHERDDLPPSGPVIGSGISVGRGGLVALVGQHHP